MIRAEKTGFDSSSDVVDITRRAYNYGSVYDDDVNMVHEMRIC